MKISLIFSGMFLVLISALSIQAQAEKLQTNSCKIAIINEPMVSDRTQGIKILVEASNMYFSVQSHSGQRENSILLEISRLKNQINTLLAQNKSISEEYVELQKLETKLKQAQELRKAYSDKNYSSIIEPVLEKIKEKMREFIKQKGYALIYYKFNEPGLFHGETVDATAEFIQFCNESFDKEKLQKH